MVNAEAGAGLWRCCECLAKTPLILSTFPVLEVGDGDPEGVGQEPLQGVVESLGGSENQVKLALLLRGRGRGCPGAIRWWWVDHWRPGLSKEGLGFQTKGMGPEVRHLSWSASFPLPDKAGLVGSSHRGKELGEPMHTRPCSRRRRMRDLAMPWAADSPPSRPSHGAIVALGDGPV